ncbi:MAG: hypothetical protein JST01_08010 [Cyanobacteria bacterium SZAS TMP-1]|nr:hypothetical protein [Cyanobacteria bacterium SZAS TMP-1]
MATDFATFGAMTATTLAIAPKLNEAAMPIVRSMPGATNFVQRGTAALAGAISGVPGAFVETGSQYLQAGADHKPGMSDLLRNIYSYSIIGAGMSAVMPVGKGPEKASRAAEKPGKEDIIYFTESFAPRYKTPASEADKHLEIVLGHLAAKKALEHGPDMLDFSPPRDKIWHPEDFDLSEFPTASYLKWALEERPIGKLPAPLSDLGLPEHETFGKLDGLARALRSLDAVLPPQKKTGLGAQDLEMPPFDVSIGDKKLSVSKIGIGEVAHVYKLSIDGHDYAFKVPNDPERMDVHGSYAETAAFAFLSSKKVSDLIDFHAANPSSKGGWLLTEFVSQPVKREGEPLSDILAQHNLRLGDDWSANRGPGNVVWDLGGIEPIRFEPPRTLEALQRGIDSPEAQMIAGRRLGNITDPAELKEALMFCLDEPAISGQVARTAAQRLKNPSDLADVLSHALDTEGAAGRAAFELDKLAGTPFIKDLYYKALRNPESRVEAAKMIDKLPLQERTEAFNTAFMYRECRAMAARSIPSLPALDRAGATAQAMEYPGSRYVLLRQRMNRGDVSPELENESNNALRQYLQSYGIDGGARPGGREMTAAQWLASREGNPEGIEIEELPYIEAIWPELTDIQKQMPAVDLITLESHWNHLKPEQWRSLTPKEINEHIELLENFHLSADESETVFKNPDLKARLEQAIGRITNGIHGMIADWESLPYSFKQMSFSDLSQVERAQPWFKNGALLRLPPADAIQVSRAFNDIFAHCRSTNSAYDLADMATKPEFARWYNEHSEFLPSSEKHNTIKVLRNWDRLSPNIEKMSPDAVFREAARLDDIGVIAAEFGADSAVLHYLSSVDRGNGTVLTAAGNWIKSLRQNELDEGKRVLQRLTSERAPAEAFTEKGLTLNLQVETYFGSHPNLKSRLRAVMDTPEKIDAFGKFLDNFDYRQKRYFNSLPDSGEQSQPGIVRMLKIALDNGFDCTKKSVVRLKLTEQFGNDLLLDDAALAHLYKLSARPMLMQQLSDFVASEKRSRPIVKDLIEDQADWSRLKAKRVNDDIILSRLDQFDDTQKSQLKNLQDSELSIDRLQYYIADTPYGADAIKSLLAEGASTRQLNNLMRLSLYPEDVAIKLVHADTEGVLRVEDVIGKTRDVTAGRAFTTLLIKRVRENNELTEDRLNLLFERATTFSDSRKVRNFSLRPDTDRMNGTRGAKAFVEAADGIMKQVPADKPIVLLGRDAWPLLPVLRARGRDAQYFMWSRLQNGDQPTKDQWLKEVPPGAVVVDSGFGGSIIDNIRHIDPSASGYLMSSSNPEYPTLISSDNHRSMVDQIEKLPKLIGRSRTHLEWGGTVSRRDSGAVDVDTKFDEVLKSRWKVESESRALLKASGLPSWDAWRYSQFVGLTPQERLGLKTREEVEQHYKNIAEMRKSQIEEPEPANDAKDMQGSHHSKLVKVLNAFNLSAHTGNSIGGLPYFKNKPSGW